MLGMAVVITKTLQELEDKVVMVRLRCHRRLLVHLWLLAVHMSAFKEISTSQVLKDLKAVRRLLIDHALHKLQTEDVVCFRESRRVRRTIGHRTILKSCKSPEQVRTTKRAELKDKHFSANLDLKVRFFFLSFEYFFATWFLTSIYRSES